MPSWLNGCGDLVKRMGACGGTSLLANRNLQLLGKLGGLLLLMVSCWKGIMQFLTKFKEAIWVKVGSSWNACFWTDLWCSSWRLCLEAPCNYEIISNRKVNVADCKNSYGVGGWNIPLRRNLNDWDMDEMAHLIGIVENIILRSDMGDTRRWTLSPTECSWWGLASISLGMEVILPILGNRFGNWKSYLKFFSLCGLLARDRLPTIDRFQRWGMILFNVCSLCLQDGESTNHVLVHCTFARKVWEAMLRDSGMTWVFSNSIEDLFHSCHIGNTSKKGKILWSMICLTVCWVLWLVRNHCIFENYVEPTFTVYKRAKNYFC